jgi:hypothetical protein
MESAMYWDSGMDASVQGFQYSTVLYLWMTSKNFALNRRIVMAKKLLFAGMVCMGLTFGILLTGCATNIATAKATNFEKKPIALAGLRQYEILGPVTLSKNWSGILGFSYGVPQLNMAGDLYFWQAGGVTYVDLLQKAQELYPDVDAVVDINVDYVASKYWVFYAKRENVVSGIAIKYVKGAAGSVFPPASDK